jgi:hypothetical protein
MIKPEMWTDAKLGDCSMEARLLFVASLNFADDNGNMDRSAKQLKAQCFPFDNLDVEALVQELLSAGRWVEYEVSGTRYLHIKNFLKHQRIDRPSKTSRPAPEQGTITQRVLDEPSTNTRRVLDEPSTSVDLKNGRNTGTRRALDEYSTSTRAERKGKEGKGKETTPTPPDAVELAARVVVDQKISKKPDHAFDQFCLAFNVTPQELLRAGQGWLGFKADFDAWIEAGAIPDLDIWPTVKSVFEKFRAQNPGKLPGSARYFTPAVTRAIEVRKATMPETVVSSVIVGPNGKVLAPNGKPWKHPPAGSLWQPDLKIWITPTILNYAIEDAKKHGYLEATLWNLEGKPHSWVPEPLRKRLQEAQDGVNWTSTYLYGQRYSSWPVRSLEGIWRLIAEKVETEFHGSEWLPPNWEHSNALEVA